ncbi:LysE family translocator [Acinetobacter rudis]|uniref:LysE family translocator n=1 Tax=Acinetobacter rudis CIP 110305 TaxID=421052 RepID=S3N8L3_9GAMM|nr:LysE family transporter [Acinetobacter rudis]EPF70679.1 hypothetical protein F945_02923 [Acinetobacter rudis CIP 110305]
MVSWFFIGLVATVLLTPGPTNTLLASSGIQVGFKRSFNLVPAEALGYLFSISFWGFIIGSIPSQYAFIPALLKLFSASYIFYLALKLWRNKAEDIQNSKVTISVRELFLATLLNPKALLFASAIFPVSAWKNMTLYSAHMLTFLLLIVPIACFWIYLGSILTNNKISWLNQNNLQKAASVVLVFFCVPLGYSAISSL